MRKLKVVCSKTSLLLGDSFSIEIHELEPGQQIRVEAMTQDHADRVWRSWATWQADANGCVNIATQEPCEGSFQGVDPYGLVYGMELAEPSYPPHFLDDRHKQTVSFCFLLNNQVMQEIDITFDFYPAATTQIEVQETFVGKFFTPLNAEAALPALLVLGGSSGGFHWSEQAARHLAAQGYAALAVAYFDWNGSYALPAQLADISLEPCLDAVKWLANHSMVDGKRIGLIGYSKGAELALLLASKLEDVPLQALVALSPSSHIFSGFSMEEGMGTSSWSFQGTPVPFLPYPETNQPLYAANLYDLHCEALKQASEDTWKQARIPVEKISVPIFVAAGEKDTVWPSVQMIDTIAAHVSSQKNLETVILHEAGHDFTLPYLPIIVSDHGLPKEEIEAARRKTWERLREFLRDKV